PHARFAVTTFSTRQTSTATCYTRVCRTRDVRPFKPGDSLTSTPGSAPTITVPEVGRCCLTRDISQSPPTPPCSKSLLPKQCAGINTSSILAVEPAWFAGRRLQRPPISAHL